MNVRFRLVKRGDGADKNECFIVLIEQKENTREEERRRENKGQQGSEIHRKETKETDGLLSILTGVYM